MAKVRRHAEEVERDPQEIDFGYSARWYNGRERVAMPDGSRRIFTAEPEQVAEDIRRFQRLGVRHVVLGFQARGLEETLERMERFGTVVRPMTER